jgi:hypothetical protein
MVLPVLVLAPGPEGRGVGGTIREHHTGNRKGKKAETCRLESGDDCRKPANARHGWFRARIPADSEKFAKNLIFVRSFLFAKNLI